MSEYPQPGLHPDPDSLNAFIEGVLPEHERLECLAHLAECPICREVVYLAQEPLPAPVSHPEIEKASFWKRWFTPIPVLSAAAVTAALVLSVALFRHNGSVPNTPELIASAPPQAMEAAPPVSPPPVSPAIPKVAPETPKVIQHREAPAVAAIAENPAVPLTTTGSLNIPQSVPMPSAAPPPPVPARRPVVEALAAAPAIATSNVPAGGQSGIAGTITDPTGGALRGATVSLRQLAGTATRNATTDASGQFSVAGLEPGRYELKVSVPGFQQSTKQVDVQPQLMARADSTLSLGSVSETVTVEASTAQINTETAALSPSQSVTGNALPLNGRAMGQIAIAAPGSSATGPLPSKLAAVTTAAKVKLMLAADSAGALFLSQDTGKTWKAVKPVWKGKVVSLATLSSPGPVFQLTTDSGAAWLSRDGSHWYAAPPQR